MAFRDIPVGKTENHNFPIETEKRETNPFSSVLIPSLDRVRVTELKYVVL